MFQKFVSIIWNNVGLSNYKRVKMNVEFRKKAPVIIQKGIIRPLVKRESLALMHLWHLSTISRQLDFSVQNHRPFKTIQIHSH